MSSSHPVADPQLERQGRRMVRPGLRFLALGLLLLVPGIVLVILGHNLALGIGILLILLSSLPGSVGVGLLTSASVARWAARHKLFA
jgi:hypothetical protein